MESRLYGPRLHQSFPVGPATHRQDAFNDTMSDRVRGRSLITTVFAGLFDDTTDRTAFSTAVSKERAAHAPRRNARQALGVDSSFA
jgi:hypothetical protein